MHAFMQPMHSYKTNLCFALVLYILFFGAVISVVELSRCSMDMDSATHEHARFEDENGGDQDELTIMGAINRCEAVKDAHSPPSSVSSLTSQMGDSFRKLHCNPQKREVKLCWYPSLTWVDSSNSPFTKDGLFALFLGQLLALLVTTTGVTSNFLSQRGVSVPTSQSFLNYLLLVSVYGIQLLRSRNSLKMPILSYVSLAFIDVEANYAVVSAYRYTTMSSVALLDCWTIPCAIILSFFVLRISYRLGHFFGVVICIVGLSLVVTSDVYSTGSNDAKHTIYGDILVIVGATLYAFANIIEEYVATHVKKSELLAMLGLFGSIISLSQLILIERKELETIQWSSDVLICGGVYALALFSFYSLCPLMLLKGGSTMFNLSLLTADIWIIVVQKMFFSQNVSWLFYFAYIFVTVGLVVYSFSGIPAPTSENEVDQLPLVNSSE